MSIELKTSARYFSRFAHRMDASAAMWEDRRVMVHPFEPRDLLMAGLYTQGYSFGEIGAVVDLRENVVKNMFTSLERKNSLYSKIYCSTGIGLSGSAQIVLWMGKQGFLALEPRQALLPVNPSVFTSDQVRILGEFMEGNTYLQHIARKLHYQLQSMKNMINGNPVSAFSRISIQSDGWYPPNILSAGYWMVRHGILPRERIGRQLPDIASR